VALSKGTRLGPYEILSPLGAGGMGEVYRARDTRLGREVAVKVLPEGLGGDPERLKRFEKEARSASALNHPNIVTIHEIGSEAGVFYIAMERVEGSTLRELLQGGPLPTKKILSIAAQAAEGLAKAHAAGIVHRDLKPENLMVTPDGLVKILDFGLAKLAGPPEASDEASSVPTVSGGTEPGVIMGTAAYMSPEQAVGKPLDFRSDQFSLGAVLYEMAAGRRPFERPTRPETLTAILREEPEPLASVALATPAPLRWIVERCLAKDPDERYASTKDLARDLAQTSARLSSMSAPGPAAAEAAPRRKSLARAGFVLLGVALGLLVAGVAVRVRSLRRTEAPPRLTRGTFSPGLQEQPAFSPDGKLLAYVTDERGNLDIVVQPRGGGTPIRVAETDADEAQPAWSPDGARLAFCSARDHGGRLNFALGQEVLTELVDGRGGDLFIAPALGGTAVKLVEDGYYPAWSPDGKRIVFQSNRGGQWDLWTISSGGGQPVRLTNDAEFDYQPSWSPDGKWIAYGSGVAGATNVRVVPATGGAPVELTHVATFVLHPSWSPDGRSIVYSAFDNVTNLWELPVSDGRAAGSPRRITLGGGQDVDAAVSRDGKSIAFATTRTNGDIWELSLPSGALRQVTSETTLEQYPELSPDGKTLLAESDRTGQLAIWTLDLSGRFREQISTIGSTGVHWSPDGRQVSYLLGGTIHIHTLGNVSGVDTGVPTSAPASFSPDGSMLAFAAPGDPALSVYTISSRAVRRLGAAPGASGVDDATWSPDASALVAHAQKETTRELWIFPADGSAPKRLTSGESEDSHPRWSSVNPDEILFLRDHRRLCVISVSTGRIRELPFQLDGTYFLDYPSWARDGKRVFFSIHRKAGNIYVIER
jgi:Tol biopolymer transport system component/predicted Ser/Thr protein kinase